MLVDLEEPGEQILIPTSSILVEWGKLDAGRQFGCVLGEGGIELSLQGSHLVGEGLACVLEFFQLDSELGEFSLLGTGLRVLGRRGCRGVALGHGAPGFTTLGGLLGLSLLAASLLS